MISSDYGELVPKTVFSKKISISSSERTVVAFGLFPRPFFVLFCFVLFFFFISFCFDFNESLNLVNSGSMNSLFSRLVR